MLQFQTFTVSFQINISGYHQVPPFVTTCDVWHFFFSVGGDIIDKAKSKYITVQTTFIVSATKPTDRLLQTLKIALQKIACLLLVRRSDMLWLSWLWVRSKVVQKNLLLPSLHISSKFLFWTALLDVRSMNERKDETFRKKTF